MTYCTIIMQHNCKTLKIFYLNLFTKLNLVFSFYQSEQGFVFFIILQVLSTC